MPTRKTRKVRPDRIDVAILTELKKYPPATVREISVATSRSYVTIWSRYKWLEQNGYIQQAENAPAGSPRSKILTIKGFQYLENVTNF